MTFDMMPNDEHTNDSMNEHHAFLTVRERIGRKENDHAYEYL